MCDIKSLKALLMLRQLCVAGQATGLCGPVIRASYLGRAGNSSHQHLRKATSRLALFMLANFAPF